MNPSQVPELQRWLLSAAQVDDGGLSLMVGLVERVRAAGIPLWRCSFSLMTKHPELVWRTVQWNERDGVTTVERSRATLDEPYFRASPIAQLRAGAPPIRERLDAPSAFPICEDLRALGGTDYVAHGLPASTGEISYISWATRAPGGFSEDALAAFGALAPYLAQRIELAAAYHGTRALLEVYLGRNAGRRVVDGGFRRGSGELISAAIWFCDLRGFTALSDDRTPHAVVATLDTYFDCVAAAIMAAGGEVLKFIGDATLAIFPVGDDPAAACRRALGAAERALDDLGRANVGRTARGEPALAIGIALHLGEVMYGNIGARDRLDFTVISSSVNEACRLEALCKTLGTPLALSQAFADAARPEAVVDLGLHALKGVRAPLRVLTLPHHAAR